MQQFLSGNGIGAEKPPEPTRCPFARPRKNCVDHDQVSVIHVQAIVGKLDPHGIDRERAFFAVVHAADHAPRSAADTASRETV